METNKKLLSLGFILGVAGFLYALLLKIFLSIGQSPVEVFFFFATWIIIIVWLIVAVRKDDAYFPFCGIAALIVSNLVLKCTGLEWLFGPLPKTNALISLVSYVPVGFFGMLLGYGLKCCGCAIYAYFTMTPEKFENLSESEQRKLAENYVGIIAFVTAAICWTLTLV
jgi:hypothetical protein